MENWNWKAVKEGIRGRQDGDVTGKERGCRNVKRARKWDAKRQSRWRKLEMTTEDRSGMWNAKWEETRGNREENSQGKN